MKPEFPDQHLLPCGGDSHLSLEVLLQLVLGELDEAAAVTAREHLLGCPDCLVRSRNLMSLPEAPASGPSEDAEKEEVWQELKVTLQLEEKRPAPLPERDVVAFPGARKTGGFDLARTLPVLAAALVLGFGLGWVLREATSASFQVAQAASTQLLPEDFSVLGATPKPPAAKCPPGDGWFFWVLGSLQVETSREEDFDLELIGPSGPPRKIGAKTNQFGEIELALPRQAVPDGIYRILARPSSGAESGTKEYRLSVDCP